MWRKYHIWSNLVIFAQNQSSCLNEIYAKGKYGKYRIYPTFTPCCRCEKNVHIWDTFTFTVNVKIKHSFAPRKIDLHGKQIWGKTPCLLEFAHICTEIKYRVCKIFTRKANIVNTAFTQYLHTVANMQEVHIHNNFPSTVNMSNITHLLQEKWIYVVSKWGKISCLLDFDHICAYIKFHVCTTFASKENSVNTAFTKRCTL